MDGSPWWVVTLKLSVGCGLGSMPNFLGPYTYSFEALIFFCSLVDTQVCFIPGLEVIGAWFGLEAFAVGKRWLAPLEMWASQPHVPTLLQGVVGIRLLYVPFSSTNFYLRLLSSLFFLCPCGYAFFCSLAQSYPSILSPFGRSRPLTEFGHFILLLVNDGSVTYLVI